MKFSKSIPSLSGTALLVVLLGCNDLGVQLAKILPQNGGSSLGTGHLSPSGDNDSIDPSQVGGGNSSMSQFGGGDPNGMNGFVDGTMNEEYEEIIANLDAENGMDGESGDGMLMGAEEDQQMMQLDDPSGGFEGGAFDSEMNSQTEMLEPAIEAGEEGSPDYLENIGAGGGLPDPQMGNYGGEQSGGGFGRGGMDKPTDGRRPQKQMPTRGNGNGGSKGSSSKTGTPNIRDRPSKSTETKPFGATNNPQKPTMGSSSQNPGTENPTSKPKMPAVVIHMPGKIVSPVYQLINTVAVPVLLRNGTAMAFSSEILQQRNLTSQGTVYWVVHSQRLGFIRFPVARGGGQVSGVDPKFTPTSGPFKAFIVMVEADGKVNYLSSPVDIKWNP
jgi:hypothetical protein